MARKILVLDSAQEEFREIKKYVKKEFGDSIWNTVNLEYKSAVDLIRDTPQIGSHIDELKDIGITNIRCVLIRQTRIVYEFDDEQVVIHMFIGTKRSFKTHLFKRLFSQ